MPITILDHVTMDHEQMNPGGVPAATSTARRPSRKSPDASNRSSRSGSVYRAFHKALRRNTDQDIQTHHCSELAELDAQQAKLWTIVDNPKSTAKEVIAAIDAMNRIHIRRARLLGLDVRQKLDIRGMYRTGTEEMSAARLEHQRLLEAMTREEQEYAYEAFAAARKRLAAGTIEKTTIQTTSTKGTENRNGSADESDDEAERDEGDRP
jgi:hypothetical protein